MIVPFLDLKAQYQSIKSEVDQAIAGVVESGTFIGGDSVRAFENRFATLYCVQNCIGVGNGTDALFSILKSIGIGPGDEVITPAFSWISTAEVVSLAGAIPVFADVDDQFLTLSVQTIESKITPRTKAVILVHLYGEAAPAPAIKRLCEQHGLALIEDCSQAHFTELEGVFAGKFGIASAFSFYPTKNLGAYGDAGCVITDDSLLGQKIRRFANHGGLSKDEHVFEGMNSRLDPIQAAVLNVKLNHISHWTDQRIKNARYYNHALQDLAGLRIPALQHGVKHTFHIYAVRTTLRDTLMKFLQENRIGTMVHYPTALPFEPAYRHLHHVPEDFPVAHRLARETLSLPIGPELSQEQLQHVAETVRSFFKRG